SAAAVVDDGVFFGCKDGLFSALELDGTLRWKFASNGPINSIAYAGDGVVVFGSWDKTVYCLGQRDGRERWRFRAKGAVVADIVRVGRNVLFGDTAATAYAVDLTTGQERLTFRCIGTARSLTVAGGNVIVATFGNLLHCLDAASGAESWRFSGRSSGHLFTRPGTVADGRIYITNTDGCLYVLDLSNGVVLWTFATKAASVSGPAIRDGRIYVGSYDCNLYCLTLDGQLVWTFPTSMSTISTIDVTGFRQEFGKEQTFTLSAPVVEVQEERYKERREGEGGSTVYASFSAYVQKSTYTTKSRYAGGAA
ncbi:MAG TPA: PQQ-binding-like beta-propeller repeat protein, partial [archaeon]|nr:PQQ-binding-like beta-propeller repeat protein [archaeon]